MAAVQENQTKKRRRRKRQTDGRRSKLKVCRACQKETKWLSVDGKCWECTIDTAKTKIPLHIEPSEEEHAGNEVLPGTSGSYV